MALTPHGQRETRQPSKAAPPDISTSSPSSSLSSSSLLAALKRPQRRRRPPRNPNDLVSVAIKEVKAHKADIWVDPKKEAAIEKWKHDPNWTPMDWKNEYFDIDHPNYGKQDEYDSNDNDEDDGNNNNDNRHILIRDFADHMFRDKIEPLMATKYTDDPEKERQRILEVNKLVYPHGYRYHETKDGVQMLAKGIHDPPMEEWRRPTTTTIHALLLQVGDRVYIPRNGIAAAAVAESQPCHHWGMWGRISDNSKVGTVENVYQICLQETGCRVECAVDYVLSYKEAKQHMNHPDGLFPYHQEPPNFDRDSPRLVLRNNITELTWPGLMSSLITRFQRENEARQQQKRMRNQARREQLKGIHAAKKRQPSAGASAPVRNLTKNVTATELKELNFRKGSIVYARFPDDGCKSTSTLDVLSIMFSDVA
jgi:hypothetical protein